MHTWNSLCIITKILLGSIKNFSTISIAISLKYLESLWNLYMFLKKKLFYILRIDVTSYVNFTGMQKKLNRISCLAWKYRYFHWRKDYATQGLGVDVKPLALASDERQKSYLLPSPTGSTAWCFFRPKDLFHFFFLLINISSHSVLEGSSHLATHRSKDIF